MLRVPFTRGGAQSPAPPGLFATRDHPREICLGQNHSPSGSPRGDSPLIEQALFFDSDRPRRENLNTGDQQIEVDREKMVVGGG